MNRPLNGLVHIQSFRSVFLTGEFVPKVSQDWNQVSTNGFLYCVPDGLLYLGKISVFSKNGR